MIPIILDSIEYFFKFMYTGNLSAGESGRAPGMIIYADGDFQYIDVDGVTITDTATLHYIANDVINSDAGSVYNFITFGSSPMHADLVTTGSTALQPSLFYRSATGSTLRLLGFNSGGWNINMWVDGVSGNSSISELYLNAPSLPLWTPYTNLNSGYVQVGTYSYRFAMGDTPHLITNASGIFGYSDAHLDKYFIPIAQDDTRSYEELEPVIESWCLSIDPDFPVESLPSFAEVSGTTEPTEEMTGQGCSIDYNEILSEDELESILTDETYILAEVDTDISQLSLQPAPVTQLPEKVVEVGQMTVSAGLDMFSQWGILTPFVSVAVFSFFLSAFRR